MNKEKFLSCIQNEPIINSHSHHLQDVDHRGLNLQNVLRSSYVNWCHKPVPDGNSKDETALWLNSVRNRSYFIWIEKAMMDLYGIDEHLDADTWYIFDGAIRKAHSGGAWHLSILRDQCNYRAIFLDTFWKPGDDNNHPDLFKPAYRVNSLFYGYNRTARDHNENNFQLLEDRSITDIDEYIKLIGDVIHRKREAGCTVIKCALAYDRSLGFGDGTKENAQRAMNENPDEDDIRAFQNYVFDRICEIAAELSMPVQIHTGLGLMAGSNAMQLQPLISRNPNTIFWLMHGSYPWTSDIAGLAHVYPNVWADLCWLPLISPTAAHRLMHELIDVCNADRVVWGCDTWTGEESYGARLAFLEILSQVLCERVDMGRMREGDAQRYARAVMYDNAAGILGDI
ncbi:MAG TPA: amidohydrolase family protein [Clostridia bacterium]|nr:amidohydrolase family protein [Clostridia bacterium]